RRVLLKIVGIAGAVPLIGSHLVKTVRASDSYSSVVLAKGPVGYWRLGETSGPTAFDLSGASHDGAYLGNPTFRQPAAIAGAADTAVSFNGPSSGDYVEIAEPVDGSQAFSQPTSGTGLTVEAWLRPDLLTFPGETAGKYIHWLGKCADRSGQC